MTKPFKKWTRHRFEEEVAQELGIDLSRADRNQHRAPAPNRHRSGAEQPLPQALAGADGPD